VVHEVLRVRQGKLESLDRMERTENLDPRVCKVCQDLWVPLVTRDL